MLKFMDGFDQFQGQAGNSLLTSLTSFGYTPDPGMAVAAGRHPGTYALELQVTAGSAGATWSNRANGINRGMRSVAHNGLRWVAVGENGGAAISDDSLSWVPVVTGLSGTFTTIAAGNDRMIAGGPAGLIAVTPDGQSWVQIPLVRPGIVITGIAFGAGVFILVGYEGSQGVIFRTVDGNDIEQVAQNIPQPLQKVAFGNGKFMAGGNNGVMRVSTDATGGLWDTRLLQPGLTIDGIAYGEDGIWLAAQGRTLYRSLNDGENWVAAVTDLVPTNTLFRVIRYSSGRWVAISNRNVIYTSTSQMGDSFTSSASFGTSQNIYDVNFSIGALGGWVGVGRSNNSTYPALIVVSVSPPTSINRTLHTEAQKVVIGFAHRATTRGRIFRIDGLFEMDWPRGIEILGVAGNAVPVRNVWYYYELVIDKAADELRLYINDHLDLTVPLPAGADAVTDYAMQWIAENGAVARIDDIILLDDDGQGGSRPIVDRIGPVQIPILVPSADVVTEFEVIPAGIEHFEAVNVLPPNLSSFIRSSTSGAKDIFTSDSPLPADAGTTEVPIFAVSVMALAQKSDLDDRQLGLVIGTGADAVEVIDDELSPTPEYSIGIFELGPGSAPWDQNNIDGLEFGVAVRP